MAVATDSDWYRNRWGRNENPVVSSIRWTQEVEGVSFLQLPATMRWKCQCGAQIGDMEIHIASSHMHDYHNEVKQWRMFPNRSGDR